MNRNISTRAIVLLFLLVLPLWSSSCFAQNDRSAKDWGDALVKWDTRCSARGCLMQTDVLRGESGNPPDPKDFHEYVGINIALERKTQQPAYFSFLIDPNAQHDQGVFIAFTRSTKEGNSWKMNIDPDGATRLSFAECNKDSCAARVPLGLVEEGKDSRKMNLIDKFLNSDTLLIHYMKNGKPYRTMVLLSSFKKEYQRVLTSEFASPIGK